MRTVTSFQELPRYVRIGDRVGVVQRDSRAATGFVETLAAQSVTLVVKDARRAIPAEQVARVTKKKRNIAAGALIGLGIGLAAGIIDASSGDSTGTPVDGVSAGASVAAGMALGTAIGELVGAMVRTGRVVYQAPVASPAPAGGTR